MGRHLGTDPDHEPIPVAKHAHDGASAWRPTFDGLELRQIRDGVSHRPRRLVETTVEVHRTRETTDPQLRARRWCRDWLLRPQ
jgi:hypothetical protein